MEFAKTIVFVMAGIILAILFRISSRIMSK